MLLGNCRVDGSVWAPFNAALRQDMKPAPHGQASRSNTNLLLCLCVKMKHV